MFLKLSEKNASFLSSAKPLSLLHLSFSGVLVNRILLQKSKKWKSSFPVCLSSFWKEQKVAMKGRDEMQFASSRMWMWKCIPARTDFKMDTFTSRVCVFGVSWIGTIFAFHQKHKSSPFGSSDVQDHFALQLPSVRAFLCSLEFSRVLIRCSVTKFRHGLTRALVWMIKKRLFENNLAVYQWSLEGRKQRPNADEAKSN